MAAVDGMLNGYIPYYGLMKKRCKRKSQRKRNLKAAG